MYKVDYRKPGLSLAPNQPKVKGLRKQLTDLNHKNGSSCLSFLVMIQFAFLTRLSSDYSKLRYHINYYN